MKKTKVLNVFFVSVFISKTSLKKRQALKTREKQGRCALGWGGSGQGIL